MAAAVDNVHTALLHEGMVPFRACEGDAAPRQVQAHPSHPWKSSSMEHTEAKVPLGSAMLSRETVAG